MLCRTLASLFIFIATTSLAQDVKTDTVKCGYYIPLDSNLVSCRIEITRSGERLQPVKQTGSILPDTTIQKISHLEPGSFVVYSDITVSKSGIAEQAASVRYVIGNSNTRFVQRDPTYPDTLTAKEIGSLILDRHIYSFSISWITGGNYYIYDLTGNGVWGEARTAIEALPSGTRVYVENIRRQEDDGTKRMTPAEIHVVR